MIEKIIRLIRFKPMLWGVVLLFLALFISQFTTSTRYSQSQVLAETSVAAIDFTLSSFTGDLIQLSQLQGKPVVLTFWSSSCSYCLDNLKIIENAKQSYQDKAAFLGIHRSDLESSKRAKLIINNFSITYPLLVDSQGVYNQYKYQNDTALTYFIDKEGMVADRTSGYLSQDVIESKINELMAE